MSIPLAGWAMKHGVLHSALFEASAIVDGWLDHGLYEGHEEKAAEVCSGWARADLVDRIACSLLARAGFDVDALDTEIAEARPQAETDVVISWERAGPTLPPGIEIVDVATVEREREASRREIDSTPPEGAPF